MKSFLLILITFITLSACTRNTQSSNGTKQNDKTETKSERQLLIEELKNLQTILASNNGKKIADIFQFPLNGSEFGIYIEDESFNSQFQKNGNQTTKNMFMDFFPQISKSIQINEFNKLLNILNLDELQQKNNLTNEEKVKTEACKTYYKIEIEKDEVALILGTNSNEDYVSKSTSEDEISDCGYLIKWTFTFDGKKLLIKSILIAG